jgi:Fe-S cluster biosynthesis and repair protein YggX
MSRVIFCSKLKKNSEALNKPPFPGALGQRIYDEISEEAWSMWISHQTMLINEYRLNLIDPEARKFLQKEMENYFFGEGSEKPSGYSPE